MSEERINCFDCMHFYTTWDKSFPKGCKMYGFKTHHLPSVMVLRTTGRKCAAFSAKNKIKSEK